MSADGRLQQLELSRARIEPGADPDRERPLVVDVADREAHGDGHAERLEIMADDAVEPHGTVRAAPMHFRELPDDDASDPIERAGKSEMRQHAVDPIHLLADVLEEEDRAAQIGHEPRADEALDQAEISADERPVRDSLRQRDHAVLPRNERMLVLRKAREAAGCLRLHEHPLEVRA